MPATIAFVLDIQVLYVERIVFDELAPCLDVFAHQRGEDSLGFGNIFKLYGEQRAMLGIHGCLPELRCGHFAQTFVTLYLILAASLLDDVVEELVRRLLFDRLVRGTAEALRSRLAP